MTPVKDNANRFEDSHNDRTQLIEYNYEGSLHIDSIHLPSLTSGPQAPSGGVGVDQVDAARHHRHQQAAAPRSRGTAALRYVRPDDVFLTPIPMPPAKHVSTGRYNMGFGNTTNYNSDTDSSLLQGGTCCQMPTFKNKRYDQF